MKRQSIIDINDDPKGLYSFVSQIQFKIAQTREELFRASTLVFKQYLESGYVVRRRSNLHFGLQDIFPDRKTIITAFDEIIFATATIIPDSFVGLPMDDLYESELNELRRKECNLCEVSMLACNNSLLKGRKPEISNLKRKFLIYYLFKYIFEYTRHGLGVDYLCITINPSQNHTYENLFFEDVGKIKPYHMLEGAPAMGKNSRFEKCKCEVKQD